VLWQAVQSIFGAVERKVKRVCKNAVANMCLEVGGRGGEGRGGVDASE